MQLYIDLVLAFANAQKFVYGRVQVGSVQGVQGAVPPAWGFHPPTPYFTQADTAIYRYIPGRAWERRLDCYAKAMVFPYTFLAWSLGYVAQQNQQIGIDIGFGCVSKYGMPGFVNL